MVIELDHVVYVYPDGTPALRDVSLGIAAGERVALLGPNGAGKTTLALHLNGVLSPVEGQVRVAGQAAGTATVRETRRMVGLVFQDPDDQLFMPTVRQDVAFGPENYRLDDIAGRVDRALSAVGMQSAVDRAPHHLSFGQRRRVAIATVLSMDPRILVLDEPRSNLDPASRRELADVLTICCSRSSCVRAASFWPTAACSTTVPPANSWRIPNCSAAFVWSCPTGSFWTPRMDRVGPCLMRPMLWCLR